MNANENTRQNSVRHYRPRLTFYKANGKCTGGALQLEVHPAHDDVDGSIMATFANQLTVGDRHVVPPKFATFDWDNSICVKLDFNDLTRMLEVFRGIKESIEDGKGLFHVSPAGSTKISLRHLVEYDGAYAFEVSRSKPGSPESKSAHIILSSSEAYGLAMAIEDSLGVICFGIPEVIARDTSAYKRRVKEMGTVPAA